MKKRILLVIPSTTYRTADFIAAAGKMDAEVVVASDHRQALAALVPDTTMSFAFDNPAQIREKVLDAHLRKPFHAVVGVDDLSAYVAAIAGETLSVSHNLPEAVYATLNKFEMRRRLEAGGCPVPSFRVFEATKNPARLAKKVEYPCVLKPLFLSASRGVLRANNRDEFVDAFSRIAALLEEKEVRRRALGKEYRQILVEGYIPGVEVAVEGLLRDGELKTLAIFDKPDPLEGPTFVEGIYVTPSRLPAYVQLEVSARVRQAALAVGLRQGPVHAELRINENGAWPVEIAARSIGGLCSRVLRFRDGVSLEELILRQALGEEVQAVQRERHAAAVMMLPIPREGVLERVDGVEEARKLEGVNGIVITIPAGQAVVPMPWGGRYLGFVFAEGVLPEDAEGAVRKAWGKLTVDIRA